VEERQMVPSIGESVSARPVKENFSTVIALSSDPCAINFCLDSSIKCNRDYLRLPQAI